ncbi:MAG: hypothetical protein H6974_08485 [Gammaproteobacteria bacterium]|nr:hypothetical protein [Gammaproteobacteria bacterium]
MLAQAARFLAVDFIPWRSVDTGTSGPLNSYVLLLPKIFGFPVDYVSGRIVALFCLQIYAVFLFLGLIRIFGCSATMLAILPTLLFIGLATERDFTHYSSELLPMALLSICFYALIMTYLKDSLVLSFLSGIFVSLVLLAKLQAAPLAAILVLLFMLFYFCNHYQKGWRVFRVFCMVILGGILIIAPITIILFLCSVFDDFFNSYINMAIAYANQPLPISKLWNLIEMTSESKIYFQVMIILLLVSIITASLTGSAKQSLILKKTLNKRFITLIGLAILFLVTAIYIVLVPGRLFPHYLMLLTMPVTILMTAIFSLTLSIIYAYLTTTH